MTLTPYIKNSLIATPLVLATLIPFVLIANALGISLHGGYVALGALGWWLALLARAPVILLVKKLPPLKASPIVVAASGPAEEAVRLVVLLVIGLTVPNGYSIGIGWAAIEIVYGIVQMIGLGVLQQKTDPKAEQAKELIKSQGMQKSLTPTAPFWGVLERISATALHIGFSLLLVLSPWLVLVAIPLHSAFNFLAMALTKKSMVLAQFALFVVGGALFCGALWSLGLVG